MDPSEVEDRIEAAIPDSEASVTPARGPDDEDHLAVEVVSPAFADETLVERHQRVHDALEEYMNDEIHALEVQTHTPAELS